MNVWLIAAGLLVVYLVACFVVCLRGDAMNRLVGLEAGSAMTVMILLLLAEAYHRAPFVDLALTLALLAFGGALVFARFLERWL